MRSVSSWRKGKRIGVQPKKIANVSPCEPLCGTLRSGAAWNREKENQSGVSGLWRVDSREMDGIKLRRFDGSLRIFRNHADAKKEQDKGVVPRQKTSSRRAGRGREFSEAVPL